MNSIITMYVFCHSKNPPFSPPLTIINDPCYYYLFHYQPSFTLIYSSIVHQWQNPQSDWKASRHARQSSQIPLPGRPARCLRRNERASSSEYPCDERRSRHVLRNLDGKAGSWVYSSELLLSVYDVHCCWFSASRTACRLWMIGVLICCYDTLLFNYYIFWWMDDEWSSLYIPFFFFSFN